MALISNQQFIQKAFGQRVKIGQTRTDSESLIKIHVRKGYTIHNITRQKVYGVANVMFSTLKPHYLSYDNAPFIFSAQ